MAKAAESAGSDLTELKALFKLAHSKPVNVAFGLGGDGKVVIKLDKTKNPKALAKALKDADPKIKNLLVGEVSIDPDDASTAAFSMNKEAGGLEAKLIVALKGTGVSKVNVSATGVADADDGQGDSDAAEAEQDAAPQSDANGDTAAATDGSVPAGAAPDAAALTAALTGLVQQMMAAIASNPAMKSTLVPLAVSAQASLKQGDLSAAAGGIANLQSALSGNGSSPGGAQAQPAAAPAPPPGPDASSEAPTAGSAPADQASIAKSRAIWIATRKKVESELDKLTKSILDTYKDHDSVGTIEKALQKKVVPILESLDDSLSDKLAELGKATNSEQHQKLAGEAQQIIQKYKQFMAGEPLIQKLDKNPFVPVSVEQSLQTALAALEKTIS
jgi:hypothetical protein